MRPLDPRLLKYAKATHSFLAFSAVNGLVNTVLIILQAFLLGDLLASVFMDGEGLTEVKDSLYILAIVVVIRAISGWLSDVMATKASNQAKSELRSAVIQKTLELGPVWVSSRQSGDLATLSTQGLNALDVYFSRYLPQLFLATAIPLTVGITVLTQDLLSAVIIGLTVPLVPLFMALIGKYSQNKVNRQWESLQALSGHFLDLVQGLPTLKVFNRAKRQAEVITKVGEDYRSSTMGVLRVSFMSSLVLELISALSLALIAISIGFRLVGGTVQLREALIVLLLVPEAYLPIRQLGAQFHAVVDGLGAAERMFEILEADPLTSSGKNKPDLTSIRKLEIYQVDYKYPNTDQIALLPTSISMQPGQLTVLKGPSGSGKSTLVNLLLSFAIPSSGKIAVNDFDLQDIEPQFWRSNLSYFPQTPWLPYGSIKSALLMGNPKATDDQLVEALQKVNLDILNENDFPVGLQTLISTNSGVSMGQRRRIAIARALLQDRPIFILDEPTASLDFETEQIVLKTLRELTRQNKIVIAVAHRPHLEINADQVIELREPELSMSAEVVQ
jgi:ATP-binding cassette subfamily C protein CydCD